MAQHRHLSLVEIGENADPAFEKYGALTGKRHAPRLPLKQANAKPIFEAKDAFAHRRPRQTDALSRRRKALGLGHVNEGVNVPDPLDCHRRPVWRSSAPG